MFDEATARRLQRLEQGTSRRCWDSAVTTASQRAMVDQGLGSPLAAPTAGERSLVDLLAERFDRLERKNDHLEWQMTRLERHTRRWKRACLGLGLALLAGLLAIGLSTFLARSPGPAAGSAFAQQTAGHAEPHETVVMP